MFVESSWIDKAPESYRNMFAYYEAIKTMFETLDKHLEYGERGKQFLPLSKNQVFAHHTDFAMYDQHPYNTWLSPWYGRFYIDKHCYVENCNIDDYLAKDVGRLAFVWVWMGCYDPCVADSKEPECWLGTSEPQPSDPTLRIYDVAKMMWSFFRVETTTEGETEGWLNGRFYPNDCGSQLNGPWKIRRFPFVDITTPYGIDRCIVAPLTKEFQSSHNNN
ncbi:MAG: hypothetical protein AAGD25_03510 [Cyanobacteria bacterium P01_F01_bin.150]